MPKSRETFHQSAVSYHTQVTTIIYLVYRLEKFAIKTHVLSFWPIRRKNWPRNLYNRPLAWHTAAAEALHWHTIRPERLLAGLLYTLHAFIPILCRSLLPPTVGATAMKISPWTSTKHTDDHQTTKNCQIAAKLFINWRPYIIAER